MSARRGFRYALEPVLATRRWGLDALRAELGDASCAVRAQQEVVAKLHARQLASAVHWQAVIAGPVEIRIDQFLRMQTFGSDLAAQLAAARQSARELAQQRDQLAERVIAAQRALEAFEEHRNQSSAAFVRAAQSRDFLLADDQWNSLLIRSENNEC
jgi:flagellar biosynthesis chaperone FliJ